MKRGFWVLIVAIIIVLGVVGFLFWPRADYSKYSKEPAFQECVVIREINYNLTKAVVNKELNLCENLDSSYKLICAAAIKKDSAVCEQSADADTKEDCLAAASGKTEACSPNNQFCFALAGDNSLCYGKEECLALASMDYAFFEKQFQNRLGGCASEYERQAAYEKNLEKCIENYSSNETELNLCMQKA